MAELATLAAAALITAVSKQTCSSVNFCGKFSIPHRSPSLSSEDSHVCQVRDMKASTREVASSLKQHPFNKLLKKISLHLVCLSWSSSLHSSSRTPANHVQTSHLIYLDKVSLLTITRTSCANLSPRMSGSGSSSSHSPARRTQIPTA